jgi:hypothetical protein
MSGGNPLHDIAVRGWLIAVLSLGIPNPGISQEQPQKPAVAEQDAGQRQPDSAPQQDVPIQVPISPEIIGPVGTDLSDAQNNAADAKRKEQREEADLKAQQDMAQWAFWMLWVTVASVAVAATAVVLVYLTLREARKTNKAAQDAVSEAEAATRVARETLDEARLSSERQLRAYVLVSHAYVQNPSQPSHRIVTVRIRNCGQTPASHVRFWLSAAVREWPWVRENPIPPADMRMGDSSLPPGGVNEMDVPISMLSV